VGWWQPLWRYLDKGFDNVIGAFELAGLVLVGGASPTGSPLCFDGEAQFANGQHMASRNGLACHTHWLAEQGI